MGRNATIHIKNETGYKLTYVDHKIEHGKFQPGGDPPREIKINENQKFSVGNNTGALVGPKGWVKYRAAIVTKGASVDVELIFRWDHPFNASTSSYTVESRPIGHVHGDLSPAVPKGHDQTVTLTVSLKEIQSLYDINNWMKYIDENKSLSELSVPGTHDSGALKGGFAFECQKLDIGTQLSKGIRFLDIRCRLRDGKLQICHGTVITKYMDISFADVINYCKQFLTTHTDETIIMLVNKEGGDPIAAAFKEEIADTRADWWWLENEIPKLKQVRKRIVLLRRFADSSLGIDVTKWDDDSASFWTNNDHIHVQDKYNVYDTVESIGNKWKDINASLTAAANGAPDKMYINFTSGSGGISPRMLATGKDIITGANGMNNCLYQTVAEPGANRYGIIAMDFPEDPVDSLISYIISTNTFTK